MTLTLHYFHYSFQFARENVAVTRKLTIHGPLCQS